MYGDLWDACAASRSFPSGGTRAKPHEPPDYYCVVYLTNFQIVKSNYKYNQFENMSPARQFLIYFKLVRIRFCSFVSLDREKRLNI